MAASRKRKRHSKPATDFEKKKRKFGKGKKTGNNVTSISFKSRNVVVPSQLLHSLLGPTTHRKQNLQVLLRQLKHHNSSVRYDALTGLREVFQSHTELIHPNLPKLVQLVFPTAVDAFPNVRQASYAFIKDLMSQQLTNAMIQPFFQVIVAQLTCGLTCICEKVQFDSLKFLDLYIHYQPDLLVIHVDKLLPLLISLLSRHKEVHMMSKSEPKGGKRKRDAFKFQVAILNNDPNSKLLNVESKMKILSVICKLLETVLESLRSDGSGMPGTSHIINISKGKVYHEADVTRQKDLTCASVCHLVSATPHIPIIHTHGVVIPDHGAQGSTTSSLTIADLFSNYRAFLRVMDTLGTLALESWVECVPARTFSAQTATIPHVTLMSKLVEVLSVMVKLFLTFQASTSNVSFQDKASPHLVKLLQKFTDGISTYVVGHFPFTIYGASRKEQFEQLQYSMNFTFCHLLMSLRSVRCKTKGNLSGDLTSVATEYLGNFEVKAMQHLAASCQFLQNCTKIIVEMIPVLWEMSAERTDDKVCLVGVFKFLKDFYNFCHPQSSSKHLLMRSLSNMFALEVAGRGLARGSSMMMDELLLPWSNSLLELLPELGESCPETCCIVVDSIATAARHGDRVIIRSLQGQLASLFGPKNVLQKVPELSLRRAIELIWYMPSLALEELSLLGRFVTSSRQGVGAVQYLIQIVHQKFMQESETSSFLPCVPAYLSFMVTILLGCSRKELHVSASSNRVYGLCGARVLITERISSSDYILDIHKTVCEYLSASLLSSADLLLCLKVLLLEIVAPPRALPVDTVCGILLLGCSFGPPCGAASSEQLVAAFAQLCLSALATQHCVADGAVTTVSHVDPELMTRCVQLSHTMLSSWPAVLEALVASLGHELSSCCSDSADLAKQCLLKVLLHPDLRPNLLGGRDRLRGAFQDVMQTLDVSSSCGIDKELELAANGYLSDLCPMCI